VKAGLSALTGESAVTMDPGAYERRQSACREHRSP